MLLSLNRLSTRRIFSVILRRQPGKFIVDFGLRSGCELSREVRKFMAVTRFRPPDPSLPTPPTVHSLQQCRTSRDLTSVNDESLMLNGIFSGQLRLFL